MSLASLPSPTSSTIVSTLLLILLGAVLPSIISSIYSKSNGQELYTDTEAILLNLELPKSRWFNMGYWTSSPASPSSNPFSEAAKALAHLVGTRANLKPGDTIMEVGYGNGDSCLLWGQLASSGGFGVKKVVGLTSLKAQREIARMSSLDGRLCFTGPGIGAEIDSVVIFGATVQRTNAFVSTEQGAGKEAGALIYELRQGDAARREAYDFVEQGSLDALVAVDCAYQCVLILFALSMVLFSRYCIHSLSELSFNSAFFLIISFTPRPFPYMPSFDIGLRTTPTQKLQHSRHFPRAHCLPPQTWFEISHDRPRPLFPFSLLNPLPSSPRHPPPFPPLSSLLRPKQEHPSTLHVHRTIIKALRTD